MISVPVVNMNGDRTGEVTIDPAVLGGEVRAALLKQAVLTFLDHQRQYSARTKRRSDVAGSTKKLYRQKGTGRARSGPIRVPQRRGGGRAFGRRIPNAYLEMPKKMRRLARNSAILAKLNSSDAIVVDGLSFGAPKTKAFATMMKAVGAGKGCVLALSEADRNVYLSGRNVPKAEVRLVEDLNAYEVLRRNKLLLTRGAFERLAGAASA